MSKPTAIIISAELAEQHANTLQGIYDLNKQGVAVGGAFLEQMLDAIRSLRGHSTQQALFSKAWEGHTDLSGVLLQRFMAGLMPDGSQVDAPSTSLPG